MADKAGRLDVVMLGKPSDDVEAESSKAMACKALWKAIKKDDYEAFASALDDFLEYREDDVSAPEADD